MLIGHSSVFLFVTGAAILLVIPGPAVMYVVSRSIGHGRAAGLVSVLGIFVGTLFQPERRAFSGMLHPVMRAFFKHTSDRTNL